jgi:undecaprenyl-diphosphatase
MDQTLLAFIQEHIRHPILDSIMLAGTTAGLLAMPLLGVTLILRGPRRIGWIQLISLAISVGAVLIVQFVVLRERPQPIGLLSTPKFPSFPSGHAAAAGATLIVVWLSWRRGWIRLLIVGWCTTVMISRIYLAHHYPSDVLAGAVLGLACGAAVWGIAQDDTHGQRWRWLI